MLDAPSYPVPAILLPASATVPEIARVESIARVLGWLVALAGLLSLLGMGLGIPLLTRGSGYHMSMAPNTSCGFLLLGVLLGRGERIQRRSDLSLSFLVAVLSMARMVELALSMDLSVDLAVPRLFPSFFHADHGSMSFFTALCFCTAVAARWLRNSFRPLSFFLSSVVGTIGLVFLLGYCYGNPLHIRGEVIPLAANTAVSFVMLGCGQFLWTVAQNRRLQVAQDERIAEMAAALTRQVVELQDANRKLKETQAHLIQAEKMASLGGLVAGIAHEINNPLAFVTNNLHVMQERLERLEDQVLPQLPDRERLHWNKVRDRARDSAEGVARISDLVVKLRLFSRLDEVSKKAVDVRQGIDAAVLLLKHRTEGRIRVVREYGTLPTMLGNPAHLNQVFLNLLSNAVDAIPDRGTVSISVIANDGFLEIAIRDTGTGIDPKIQPMIFDPFFTTKPVGTGIGLGLSNAYSIVEAHRGQLLVRSPLDPGTEIIVRLPLKQGKA